MTEIETQTTHTVKIAWKHGELISKSELISELSNALPDRAEIMRLAVTNEASAELRAVRAQTLTITYMGGYESALGKW
jgi:hypothetical protein